MNCSIEISNVSKAYGKRKALDGVSLSVREADMFALLGPNGAGKSTLIDILCTLGMPDEGVVKIHGMTSGMQDAKIREHIGVVFQNSMLDDLLSVEENLMSRCGCYHIFHREARQRIRELDDMIGLRDILHQKTSTLSGGQRRRVDIARALLAKPDILILDEPTTGLDPSGRAAIWNMIKQLQSVNPMTVFFTTHYLEEAKKADFLCLLKEGHVIAQGTPRYIREMYAGNRLCLFSSCISVLAQQLQKLHIAFLPYRDHLTVMTADSRQAFSILKRTERFITDFEYVGGTLDDAFLSLMEGGISHDDMDAGKAKHAAVL